MANPSQQILTSLGGAIQGQQAFTTAGTFTWTCPVGVTSVSVVLVGAGRQGSGSVGGSGGALCWKNSIAVTEGVGYAVKVPKVTVANGSANDGDATFTVGGTVYFAQSAFGGNSGVPERSFPGTTRLGDGGGNGGNGTLGTPGSGFSSGGAGAGGYSGNGGNGGNGTETATAGAGGGGGGGNASGQWGGGGVGLLGEGANGAPGAGGRGGSGGENAGAGNAGNPGNFGGGGGTTGGTSIGLGRGAVRIIWGPSRSFPSTNTGNV